MSSNSATPIRVVVADKSSLVRKGLEVLLAEDPRFEPVALANDGVQFLAAVEKFKPSVGVIGWVMPNTDGRQVLQALRDDETAPRLIVYTGHAQADVPRQVMSLGGAGFCFKSDPPEQLLDAIASAAAGRMVFPFVDVRALHDCRLGSLTTRERELLAALSDGHSNAQIAARYEISVQTVKFHLKNVYEKLQVGNRAHAVALYVSENA
jgi:two-component system nitrate/nitrite response regulator NarL